MSKLDDLKKYASDYYQRTEVTNPQPRLFRIFVPEADQEFLLGLGKFNVTISKIRPLHDDRIVISVLEV